jgi:hypothetical protein
MSCMMQDNTLSFSLTRTNVRTYVRSTWKSASIYCKIDMFASSTFTYICFLPVLDFECCVLSTYTGSLLYIHTVVNLL